MRVTSVSLLALVVALPSLVLAQNTTAAPSSGVTASASTATSASVSVSSNATASATGNSTSIASNSTTALVSSATSANSTPLTTAATPAELTNTAFTAVTPGASGTIASGPGDNYIAAAGRSAQVQVLAGLGAVGLGAWALL